MTTYTVLDFETTGLDHVTEQITEIGATKYDSDFNEIGTLHTMVKLTGTKQLPKFITELTGITENDLIHGLSEATALNMLKDFIADSIVIAQHAPFDLAFLAKAVEPELFIDTRSLGYLLDPTKKANLKELAKRYNVILEGHHRSMNDVATTAELAKIMMAEADAIGLPYTNLVFDTKERPLKFIPINATVADGTGYKNDYIKRTSEIK